MAKAPVRVRGMNAAAVNAAAVNGAVVNGAVVNGAPPGGGADVHERFPHASIRQLLLAVALLACGSLIAWFTFAEVTGGPTSFSGTVVPQQSVGLDFSQNGRVAQVLVKPGDKVTKGEPLATEDLGSAQATLADAEAVLSADEAKVRALQEPNLSAATKQGLDSEVAQATAQLSGAQRASTDAMAQADTEIAQARQTLSGAKAVRDADTAQFDASCPAGAVPPTSAVAHRSSPAPTAETPPTGSAYQDCLSLRAQVQKDTPVVDSAAANLARTQADAAQLRDSAASATTSAGAALAAARGKQATANSPASAADLSAAQADVATARRAVDQDKELLGELTLVAPIDGIVADVSGIVGDLDGSEGVRTLSGPRSMQLGSGSAFSLFPPAAGADTNQGSNSRQQPLVSLVTSQSNATAEVSEDAIGSLHPGRRARVTVDALGRTVNATVAQIVPIPVDQSGKVNYQVLITASSWPAGVLPGMSLSVVFP